MPAASSSCVQTWSTCEDAGPKIGMEATVHKGAMPGTTASLDPAMIEWTCVPCSTPPLGRLRTADRAGLDRPVEHRDHHLGRPSVMVQSLSSPGMSRCRVPRQMGVSALILPLTLKPA